MKITSDFRQLRPEKMFHCPVAEPQNVFHCPANRVSFHGNAYNVMCLIVRYFKRVPRTCFTFFERSKCLPYLTEGKHRRFHRFAQENSAIVLASMLACYPIPGERWVSAHRYRVLSIISPISPGRLPLGARHFDSFPAGRGGAAKSSLPTRTYRNRSNKVLAS